MKKIIIEFLKTIINFLDQKIYKLPTIVYVFLCFFIFYLGLITAFGLHYLAKIIFWYIYDNWDQWFK